MTVRCSFTGLPFLISSYRSINSQRNFFLAVSQFFAPILQNSMIKVHSQWTCIYLIPFIKVMVPVIIEVQNMNDRFRGYFKRLC